MDVNIYKETDVLNFSTQIKLFKKNIKNILLKFKIDSNIYTDTRAGVRLSKIDSWSLIITGRENFIKFNKLIGFADMIKKKKLKDMILSYT